MPANRSAGSRDRPSCSRSRSDPGGCRRRSGSCGARGAVRRSRTWGRPGAPRRPSASSSASDSSSRCGERRHRASLLGRVSRGEIGGVILFGGNVTGPAQVRALTKRLQETARAAGRPPLIVALDQEGGSIRRLPWVGPSVSTSQLGSLPVGASAGRRPSRRSRPSCGRASTWTSRRSRTSRVSGSFMAAEGRTFSSDPAAVGDRVAAFAAGLGTRAGRRSRQAFPGYRPCSTEHRSHGGRRSRPARQPCSAILLRSASRSRAASLS